MYVIAYEYEVAASDRPAFEATYGSDGPWTGLFGTAAGYLGTDLLRDAATGGRYLLLDRWESGDAFRAFLTGQADAYAELDQRCRDLHTREQRLGGYEIVVPQR